MSSGKRRKLCDVVTVVLLLRAGCYGSDCCGQAGQKLSAVPEGYWTVFPERFS